MGVISWKVNKRICLNKIYSLWEQRQLKTSINDRRYDHWFPEFSTCSLLTPTFVSYFIRLVRCTHIPMPSYAMANNNSTVWIIRTISRQYNKKSLRFFYLHFMTLSIAPPSFAKNGFKNSALEHWHRMQFISIQFQGWTLKRRFFLQYLKPWTS